MAKKKLDLGTIAAAAGGGLAVGMVADKVLPSLGLPDSVTPFIPAALGVFLAMQKNPLLTAVGLGMVASATPKALNAVGINIGAPFNLIPGGQAYVETLQLPQTTIMSGVDPAYSPIGLSGVDPAINPLGFS